MKDCATGEPPEARSLSGDFEIRCKSTIKMREHQNNALANVITIAKTINRTLRTRIDP